jgi:hypothetical protein
MSEKIKTEKRTLRYDFTAVETHDLSLSLANKTKEKVALEEEKKSVMSQYKAKLDEVTAHCNKLSNQVSDGFEYREVDCEIEYHSPENGKKTVTRLDTKNATVEKMETWEYNLFNQSGLEGADEDFDELAKAATKKTAKKSAAKKTAKKVN